MKLPSPVLLRTLGAALTAGVFAVPHLVESQTPPAIRNCIMITMTGLRNTHGMVRMGLYDNPARWPRPDGAAMTCAARIVGNEATCGFEPVRPGLDFAVAGSHDENNNGHFDQNILGIPLEGYAFTNNARPALSAPSFDECKVRFTGGIMRLNITTQY